jgi:hypothetical protein
VEAGVRLIVPMNGSERPLAGLMLLGDKKSDEPYSSDDLRLLQGDRTSDRHRTRERPLERTGGPGSSSSSRAAANKTATTTS